MKAPVATRGRGHPGEAVGSAFPETAAAGRRRDLQEKLLENLLEYSFPEPALTPCTSICGVGSRSLSFNLCSGEGGSFAEERVER